MVGAILHQEGMFVSALVARGSHKRHGRLRLLDLSTLLWPRFPGRFR
jgi:hypothetical protein